MLKDMLKKRNNSYYRPLKTAVLSLFYTVAIAIAWWLVGVEAGANTGTRNTLIVKYPFVMDAVHDQQIKFAAYHGVADPAALVAAVRHSPMANLLISVAIEESRGDPVAVGSAGEQGAWQVIASHWGSVPKDLFGQAEQAERIITALLSRTNGNKKKALARYNGGATPPVKSYQYAERILKRARHLRAAVNFLPPNYTLLKQAMFSPPYNSWKL